MGHAKHGLVVGVGARRDGIERDVRTGRRGTEKGEAREDPGERSEGGSHRRHLATGSACCPIRSSRQASAATSCAFGAMLCVSSCRSIVGSSGHCMSPQYASGDPARRGSHLGTACAIDTRLAGNAGNIGPRTGTTSDRLSVPGRDGHQLTFTISRPRMLPHLASAVTATFRRRSAKRAARIAHCDPSCTHFVAAHRTYETDGRPWPRSTPRCSLGLTPEPLDVWDRMRISSVRSACYESPLRNEAGARAFRSRPRRGQRGRRRRIAWCWRGPCCAQPIS